MAAIETDIKRIQRKAREAKSSGPLEVRLDIGDACPQGDVNVIRILALPRNAKPRKNRQLAEGSSKGSRHILADGPALYDVEPGALAEAIADARPDLYASDIPSYVCGPVFLIGDEQIAELNHPEHDNHLYPEPGVYAVTYQRTMLGDGREARALD